MIKNFEILTERTGFPAIITENGECFDIGDRGVDQKRDVTYLAIKIQEIINYINKEKEYEI